MIKQFIILFTNVFLLGMFSSCNDTSNYLPEIKNVVTPATNANLDGKNLLFSIDNSNYSLDLKSFSFYPVDKATFGFEGYSADCSFNQSKLNVRVPRLDLIKAEDGTFSLDGTININGNPSIYSVRIDNLSDLSSSFNLKETETAPEILLNQQLFESWYLRTNTEIDNDAVFNYYDDDYQSATGISNLSLLIDSHSRIINNSKFALSKTALPPEIKSSYFTKNTTFTAAGYGCVLFLQTTLIQDTDTVDRYMTDVSLVQVVNEDQFVSSKLLAAELNVVEGITYFVSVENGVPMVERAVVNNTYKINNVEFAWLFSCENDLVTFSKNIYASKNNNGRGSVDSTSFDAQVGVADKSKFDVENKDKMISLLDSTSDISNLTDYTGGNLPSGTTYIKAKLDSSEYIKNYGLGVNYATSTDGFSDYANFRVNYRFDLSRENICNWIDDSKYDFLSSINGYTGGHIYSDRITLLDF